MRLLSRTLLPRLLLVAAFIATTAVYWPGLSGSFLFDDYPNIVDNKGVQPQDTDIPSLFRAALSSPSSEFKRPLASLSFAANYLATGLDPFWMKLTNLVIHLLNGLLIFLLSRMLLLLTKDFDRNTNTGMVAAIIAAAWMLLPINLTGVLYIVQRMESMANLFVLLGLIGYISGRKRMLEATTRQPKTHAYGVGLLLSLLSITIPTILGLLAKETAVMLPLYAALIEWAIFRFVKPASAHTTSTDQSIIAIFLLVLVLPMILGVAWLLPGLLRPETWATRDFTLGTRLLSEARIVVDYIVWTVLPTPGALSFYHDDFLISKGLLAPWTTLTSILILAALIALMLWLRPRRPLAALGIALFLGCQLLTGTILRLELIYEHRNYFASFGLMLAIVPLLTVPRTQAFALPRQALLVCLLLLWTIQTALTSQAWSSPLHLAEELASRAPKSPRAQYELGRTYIIYSHYDPASPFTELAYAPLEKAASLPGSSILPEQALIFMNSRMHLPLKDAWWHSMIGKLRNQKPGVQDESSLGALTQCARERRCDLPRQQMVDAYLAALSHPSPSARLLAMYGDYAWNVLEDHELGMRMTEDAVKVKPNEAAYRITQVRMLVAERKMDDAKEALKDLQTLNTGGSLDSVLRTLADLPGMRSTKQQ